MKKLIICLLLAALIAGCAAKNPEASKNENKFSLGELSKIKCTELCKTYSGNKTNGPCLSDNNPEWNVNDWVCDIAHSPRQTVDNETENQCKEFREGRAEHFVEVDEKCEIIKAV